MKTRIIAVDQSTSATKALLFDEDLSLVAQASEAHRQIYPQTGWVEHDPMEIFENTVKVIWKVLEGADMKEYKYVLSITNQRETIVAWDRTTGLPVYNALVWQDTRGARYCDEWKAAGLEPLVQEHTGLKIDPSFCASKMKWILDNVEGARALAEAGNLCFGTIDAWLIWKLTEGRTFATDYTNASRTMVFNIHTLAWDPEVAQALGLAVDYLPEPRPCDALYGETTVGGFFEQPIQIAGVLGDSHGALAGQMCFAPGEGKVTYGTGSSVQVNIGPKAAPAPEGLVTSIGFSVLGTTYYSYEGNIYSTGATLKWLAEQARMIEAPHHSEACALNCESTGGVYFIPAFAGLGAPWFASNTKAAIVGMTFSTNHDQIVRAAVESIAFQVKDLVAAMLDGTGVELGEISADGGPTKNQFLMQLQADLLERPIVCTEVEDASALGAAVVAGFAVGLWKNTDEVKKLKKIKKIISPNAAHDTTELYAGWRQAVTQLINH